MKTPAQRQQYLIDNPMIQFHNDQKSYCIMFALLGSEIFRLNTWSAPIHNGVRARRLAEQTTSVLNNSSGIVWC